MRARHYAYAAYLVVRLWASNKVLQFNEAVNGATVKILKRQYAKNKPVDGNLGPATQDAVRQFDINLLAEEVYRSIYPDSPAMLRQRGASLQKYCYDKAAKIYDDRARRG